MKDNGTTIKLLKVPTPKHLLYHPEIWTRLLYHRVMHPKDADRMANSVDPDQTAPLVAVWSGSALFAQTCLSENLGSLQYVLYQHKSWWLAFQTKG